MTMARPQQKPSMIEAAMSVTTGKRGERWRWEACGSGAAKGWVWMGLGARTAVSTDGPDDQHEGAGAHDRREERLNSRAVLPGRVRHSDECANDGRIRSLGTVDHARAAAEERADETDHPRGVQRDGRLDVRHEGEGDRLGDLSEANGDAKQHLSLEKVDLARRRPRVPLLVEHVRGETAAEGRWRVRLARRPALEHARLWTSVWRRAKPGGIAARLAHGSCELRKVSDLLQCTW